jgi:manganese/zinc/iron transport system substrate-binding protein
MQKQHLVALCVGFLCLSGGLFWAVRYEQSPLKGEKKDSKIAVICTTSLIFDVVQRLGGERIEARALMGPGVDPHLYRAREGDIHALIAADIIFYNGLHLEGKMGDLLAKMGSRARVVAVSDCIPKDQLRSSEFVGICDPHIWHDVALWAQVVQFVGEQLGSYAPEHATYFISNADAYLQELSQLEEWMQKAIATIPMAQRVLVTAHDAFGYFGASYGFEVVGLQGMSTDAEVGTKDMTDLVSFLVSRRVPVIFIESSISQRNIEAVQKGCAFRGWPIKIGDELFSDALSDDGGPASTYVDMMKHNVKAMIEGLAS